MNKGYSLIFLISILMIGSSCNSGYYAYLPRVKKPVAKVEIKERVETALEEIKPEQIPAAVTTVERVSDVALKVSEEAAESTYKPEIGNSNTEVLEINNPYLPIIKQHMSSSPFPEEQDRNGYPDSSLWFFYVGVFLMIIGLVFIIIPALGFGVGLPFLLTGAIIMIMGLFLA